MVEPRPTLGLPCEEELKKVGKVVAHWDRGWWVARPRSGGTTIQVELGLFAGVVPEADARVLWVAGDDDCLDAIPATKVGTEDLLKF